MKINEADYVVAVDAANHKQMLTIHQAVLQERDELKAQVEQLQHRINDLKAANKLSGKCLAEIRAQAIDASVESINGYITISQAPSREFVAGWNGAVKGIKQYAKQIK